MNPALERGLLRHAKPIAIAVGAGSWLPFGLFVLLVTSVEFRLWKPPCGQAINGVLLVNDLALALLYGALFTSMAAFWRRRSSGQQPDSEHARRCLVDSIMAALSAIVAGWCVSALLGHPLVVLVLLSGLVWTVLQAAVFVIEMRRGRRWPAESSRPV